MKLSKPTLDRMLKDLGFPFAEDDQKADVVMKLKKVKQWYAMNPKEIATECRTLGINSGFSVDALIDQIYRGAKRHMKNCAVVKS